MKFCVRVSIILLMAVIVMARTDVEAYCNETMFMDLINLICRGNSPKVAQEILDLCCRTSCTTSYLLKLCNS